LYADYNVLESVILTNNPNLTTISLYDNHLTNIDVSRISNLKKLYLGNNFLTILNISKNTKLKNLAINNMPTLLQVCVWTIPLPEFYYIDNSGSPNMYLSLDCIN
jgi:Leucine-rich repeat (LRR) protein